MTATVASTARRAAGSETLDWLARFGLAARGALYVLLGVLSVLLAFGKTHAETDQRGAMQDLVQHSGGFVVVLLVALGLCGYALWRFSEAAFGVAGKGKKALPRAQSFVRGVVYASIAASAFTIAVQGREKSQATQQQAYSARLMHATGGRWLVGLIGAVVVVIGLALIYRGITRSFEKHFKLGEMSPAARRTTEVLGTVGSTARGAVFAVAGVLITVAAVQFDPRKARGIDGALRTLRDTALGPWLLVVVALGLIMFGLFGFCEARWRRT
jgi:hypothetical protein